MSFASRRWLGLRGFAGLGDTPWNQYLTEIPVSQDSTAGCNGNSCCVIYSNVYDAGKSHDENVQMAQAAGFPIQCGPGNLAAPTVPPTPGRSWVTYDPTYPAPPQYPGAVPGTPNPMRDSILTGTLLPTGGVPGLILPPSTPLPSGVVNSAGTQSAPGAIAASAPSSSSGIPTWMLLAGGGLALYLFTRK